MRDACERALTAGGLHVTGALAAEWLSRLHCLQQAGSGSLQHGTACCAAAGVHGSCPCAASQQLPTCHPPPRPSTLPPTEGSKLWAIYRGFELSLLEAEPTEEQAERVRGLWARQLAVPLADGPDTLAAYEEWERSQPGEWLVGGGRPLRLS